MVSARCRPRSSSSRRWTARTALLALCALLALALTAGSSAAEEVNCSAAANPVKCENALPGTPEATWAVKGIGDSSMQGYATAMSLNAGETEKFKVKTTSSSYHLDVYRLGYYEGNGARLVAANLKPTATLPQSQPECLKEAATGLIDCGNWGVSAQWTVPSTAVSGVYIALLTRSDTGGKSQIIFVVRNDASHSKLLVQTSDATWQAYNAYGGNSLYTCTVSCPAGSPKEYKGAYAVSYNRPFDGALATDNGASYLYYAEDQMIRFLESNGYDTSYTSASSVDASGALLKNHQIFVSSGHDEYWSGPQRANVEAARDGGVNLAFFSANEIFWKTRWGNSIDGASTPYRTVTSYKESHFEGPVDPQGPATWTGSWRDPRGGPASDGGRPENSLSGQQFQVNSGTSEITVPARYSNLRMWRNTAVASLKEGQTLTLAPGTGTLGYEWDEDVENGFRPAGQFQLSQTSANELQSFTDYGTTLAQNSVGTHHLILYRAPSGALVFGAGTVQWAWGLDDTNVWDVASTNPGAKPPDPNMQQATVNLLADMGAQPETLIAGLVPPVKTTDTTAPSSSITAPTGGETVKDASKMTVAGTAADGGGGVVAGVEVSTDNATSWHQATLTGGAASSVNWTYTTPAHGYPTATIRSRAVDDSANLETPSGGVQVKVSCPCTIWGETTPTEPNANDENGVELGLKFTTETFGQITGVRFYKSTANTGTHTGSLWTTSGERLATATFTGESLSGWQQVNFATPVSVSPGTTYIASYFAPKGHYAATANYLFTPPPVGGTVLNSPPLHAVPANGAPSGGAFASANGLYSYGSASSFPSSSYTGTNYWVDPVFAPATPAGQATNVAASAGPASATVSWNAPTSGGPVTKYTVTPFVGSEAKPSTTVSGNPPATNVTITGLSNGTTYTFTVTASNPAGSGAASEPSNAVTPNTSSAPSAPTAVSAIVASGQAQVSWTAPVSNGGSAITGYTVTPYIGTSAQKSLEVGASTSANVKGLTNGTAYTFKVGASNGSGEGPQSIPSSAVIPLNTIFDFANPATVDSGDTNSVELGVKFTAETAGNITGIRFYKAPANNGSHVVSLYSSTGTVLASATSAGESASGWQQVNFAKPVPIAAGTTYVAAYFAPNGHYSYTSSGMKAATANGPLTALANATSANGVYAYSGASTFPNATFSATNYWVDADFEGAVPTVPGPASGVTASAGPGSASVSWTAPATGGAVTKYLITPYIGSEAQPATTITGGGGSPPTSTTITGLTNGTTYTFTVTAGNGVGNAAASGPSNAVTPSASSPPSAPSAVGAIVATNQAQVSWTAPSSNGGSPITGYTVTPFLGATPQTAVEVGAGTTSTTVIGLTNGSAYTFKVSASNAGGEGPQSPPSGAVTPQNTIFDFATPATLDSGDSNSVELGVKFTAETAGNITGIRFYKAPANTGSHIVSLFTSTGTLLASATASGESASGWQQVNFAKPVAITAATTYVAAYLAPNGRYSDNPAGFGAAIGNPPLTALANATTPDGVYAYTASSVFPTNSFNATNYWVDVDFEAVALAPPGPASGASASPAPGSANVSWSAPTTGGAVSKYVITPFIGSEAQPATTIAGGPPATSATVTGLKNGTSYTFTVTAGNSAGNAAPSAPSGAVTPSATTPPAAPSGVGAIAATAQALVNWSAPSSNGGSAITGYTITPFAGAVAQKAVTVGAASTSTTVKGLSNGTSYTFRVSASNASGEGSQSAASPAVTPANTIFDFATPATVDSGDSNSVVLGVKFSSESAGHISAIRFYKAAANTGPHTVSLYASTGTLLASATSSGESASGWQQVSFAKAVAISAATTYIAAYFAPSGHYSDTPAGFGAATSNAPLTALANSTTPDGVYAYSATNVFPTNSFNATNYWVDVVYEP